MQAIISAGALALGLVVGACTAVPGAPSPALASDGTRASLPPAGITAPPLNQREVRVIDALARLGVVGQRAQLPFNEANIWARVGPGTPATDVLFVSAYPAGEDRSEYTIVDERVLEGIQVKRVRSRGSSAPTYRFECFGDTYMISGNVPPGFADMDVFVGGFIHTLDCHT